MVDDHSNVFQSRLLQYARSQIITNYLNSGGGGYGSRDNTNGYSGGGGYGGGGYGGQSQGGYGGGQGGDRMSQLGNGLKTQEWGKFF